MRPYQSINPATGVKIKDYPLASDKEIEDALVTSYQSSNKWMLTSFNQRRNILNSVIEKLEENRNELSLLMTQEMGKPISQSIAEIDKCKSVISYYADNAENFLKDEPVLDDQGKKLAYINCQPMGVVLAIMPWNFPCWQLFRFLAPAVMAGNVVIMKHAENVPGTAEMLTNIFHQAGFEKGLFQNIFASHQQIQTIIKDSRVAGVTFTGSTEAGRKIGVQAASSFKKSVLELGGSDPYIVLEDADIDLAAGSILDSRTINNGQSCIAAKRAIVSDRVYEKFCKVIVEKAKKYQLGNPEAQDCLLGPLARKDLLENLNRIYQASLNEGATEIFKSETNMHQGYYFPLTILSNVTKEMTCFKEETFGPLLSISKASSEEQAISLATNTKFGLGAAIFSKNIDRCKNIATKLPFGSIAINGFVKSNPFVPFGGLKESGLGKELGKDGIHEFVYKKSILV